MASVTARRSIHSWSAHGVGALRADDCRRAGRNLGGEGEGIGLEDERPVGRHQLELVAVAGLGTGDEQLPHPRPAQHAHGVDPTVPAVEVAHHPQGPGRRRPHRERCSPDALVLPHVGAHDPPERLVAALAEQVEVEVAHRGPEPVGVLHHEGARVVGDGELVGARLGRAGDGGLEQPRGVDPLRRGPGAVGQDDLHRRRVRAPGPHHVAVEPEDLVGVGVTPGGEGVDLPRDVVGERVPGRHRSGDQRLGRDHVDRGRRLRGPFSAQRDAVPRRRRAVRGMCSHSGRWARS